MAAFWLGTRYAIDLLLIPAIALEIRDDAAAVQSLMTTPFPFKALRMKIVRAALVLTLSLPVTASWAVSFEGSWATDQEHCAKPDNGNIRIVGSSYFSHMTECAIRNIARRPLG